MTWSDVFKWVFLALGLSTSLFMMAVIIIAAAFVRAEYKRCDDD